MAEGPPSDVPITHTFAPTPTPRLGQNTSLRAEHYGVLILFLFLFQPSLRETAHSWMHQMHQPTNIQLKNHT